MKSCVEISKRTEAIVSSFDRVSKLKQNENKIYELYETQLSVIDMMTNNRNEYSNLNDNDYSEMIYENIKAVEIIKEKYNL